MEIHATTRKSSGNNHKECQESASKQPFQLVVVRVNIVPDLPETPRGENKDQVIHRRYPGDRSIVAPWPLSHPTP